MSLSVDFRLRSPTLAIPQVAIAKTIGRNAVVIFQRLTPVRTGKLRASWSYVVGPAPDGVVVSVYNPQDYAAKVMNRRLILAGAASVRTMWTQVQRRIP